jgi:hypothetical protein
MVKCSDILNGTYCLHFRVTELICMDDKGTEKNSVSCIG